MPLACPVTKVRTSSFIPIDRLRPGKPDLHGIQLPSRTGVLTIQALADDLFRVRFQPVGTTPEPSWAVIKPNGTPPSFRIQSRGAFVSLRTHAAQFRIDRTSGAWAVTDSFGIEIFRAPARALGFTGQEARLSLALADREAIFGLGETTGTFNKRGLIREFWNTDVLGHAPAIHPSLRSLYVSIPFALSLRDGRVAGLFWDNPTRQTWDLGQTRPDVWQMTAASGVLDLYLFIGPKISQVLERYTELTGRMPLPPRWGLGYQ